MNASLDKTLAWYKRSRDRSPYPGVTPPAPSLQTCTKVYRTAGQYKRGVQEMTRQGWEIVAQSSATPSRAGFGLSTGWTKTLVTFRRVA